METSALRRVSAPGLAVRAIRALCVPVLAVLGVFACGEAEPRCVPGQSISCATAGGCMGHQICNADGSAYEECQCESNEGFPQTGPNSGLIGAACTGAASCRLGLDCLSPDSKLINGRGPSAGICLAKCLPDHDFCREIDARSRCVVIDNGGTVSNRLDDIAYCLPGCKIGTQANELDKCRGRSDLVCSELPLGSGVGFCVPACRSDRDCGERHCDLGTGLCQDAPPSGDAIGAACSPTATTLTCQGACLARTQAYAECSGVCSFDTPGCGQQTFELPLDYYCHRDPRESFGGQSGAGDLGYCAKLCDCDQDCGRPDAVCEPVSALTAKTGRAGVCGSKLLASGATRQNQPCQSQ